MISHVCILLLLQEPQPNPTLNISRMALVDRLGYFSAINLTSCLDTLEHLHITI